MLFRHVLLALLVALFWGGNFIVAKFGTQEIPPFLLIALRTALSSLPLIFFFPKPKNLSWSLTFSIGFCINVGKMSCLFWSIYLGLSPGIAALILQTQVIFTIILAKILYRNTISLKQALGVCISLAGMLVIGTEMQGGASFSGFLCVLFAAVLWSISNMLFPKAKDVDSFTLIVWCGLVSCFPLFALSYAIEGWDAIVYSLNHVTWVGISALIFTIVAASWIGATCWAYLFRKYPPTTVSPYALLIPVVAIILSLTLLDEDYSNITLIASGVVFLGLVINQWPEKIGKSEKNTHLLKKAA